MRRFACLTAAAIAAVPTLWAGELRSGSFAAASLGRDAAYVVHLPPSYDSGERRYPVVYALHGLFEGAGFWERRGLADLLDAAWAAGQLPELIVAAVDGGNSFFVNGPAGAWQDLVTRDFVEHVDAHYRTLPRRESRALLGVSMGGYAALRIALAEPSRFGAVATHSAMLLGQVPSSTSGAGRWHMAAFHRVFGEPIDAARWEAADPLRLARTVQVTGLPALYLDCGASDRYGLHQGHRSLHATLQERGVAHEFALPPGDHGYAYVRSVLGNSLRFLAQHLEGDETKEDP